MKKLDEHCVSLMEDLWANPCDLDDIKKIVELKIYLFYLYLNSLVVGGAI
jgi:hypothetical protein